MNIKKIAAAVTLGLMSVAATASTLSTVTGDVEIKLGGLTTETQLTAGTDETTWGVGYLESIASFSNLSKWTSGTTDGYLYYMLYGIADLLWPLWDAKKQAVHDKIARTNVVLVR